MLTSAAALSIHEHNSYAHERLLAPFVPSRHDFDEATARALCVWQRVNDVCPSERVAPAAKLCVPIEPLRGRRVVEAGRWNG